MKIRLKRQSHTDTEYINRPCFLSYFLSIFIICFSCITFASNLKITPVRLQMQALEKITLLNIKNQGDFPINVQIIPHKWEQMSGEDILTPTSDILILPPILSLNPGHTQSIRIARRAMMDLPIEQNYRLIVKEFDTITEENNAPGLRLKLNISLPLFILPKTINTNYIWKVENKTPQTKKITLINKSNVHVILTDIKLVNEHDKTISESIKMLSYVLPFQSKEWDITTIDHVESSEIKVLSNISFPENIR